MPGATTRVPRMDRLAIRFPVDIFLIVYVSFLLLYTKYVSGLKNVVIFTINFIMIFGESKSKFSITKSVGGGEV